MVDKNYEVNEEFLGCRPLYGRTTGADVFQALKTFLDENSIDMTKLVSVCTDGAPAMTSQKVGLVGNLMKEGLNFQPLACAIHQVNLCAKRIGLEKTMQTVQNIVNKLKSGHQALTHRKFKTFLEEFGSETKDLVLFTEIRWLSKANCLKRFFELRTEIKTFLQINNEAELTKWFDDDEFMEAVAFLTDITARMNSLFMDLEGNDYDIMKIISRINEFKNNLIIFKNDLDKLIHFPSCKILKQENDTLNFTKFQDNINNVEIQFNQRFKDFEKLLKYVGIFYYPLTSPVTEQPPELQLELSTLQADLSLNQERVRGTEFLKLLNPEKYPNLRNATLRLCAMFGTTYRCESAFSKMKYIKDSYRSRLTDAHLNSLLRISMNHREVDFDEVIKTMYNRNEDLDLDEPSTSSQK